MATEKWLMQLRLESVVVDFIHYNPIHVIGTL